MRLFRAERTLPIGCIQRYADEERLRVATGMRKPAITQRRAAAEWLTRSDYMEKRPHIQRKWARQELH